MDEHTTLEEQFAQAITEQTKQNAAERAKEIEALGCPEWSVRVFQRLRRFAEELRSGRGTSELKDVAARIDEILQTCPQSLFDFDKKTKERLDAAFREFVEAFSGELDLHQGK